MNRTPYCRHSIVYIWAILASICSLNTGWDIGIIATAIIYIQKDLGLNDSQIQYMVASTNFFAIFGSIIGGQCAHKFGRKKVIISTAIASFFAVLLMAPTSNFGVILLCRSIFGLCAGSAVVVTSMLIAEISPADIRGKMVSFSPVLRNIAHVLGYTMALSLHYYGVNDSMAWRVMIGSGAIISIILAIAMLFMPESPRWLCQNGFASEARSVLEKTCDSKETVDKTIQEMMETNEASDSQIGWKQIIFPCCFKPDVALRTALSISTPIMIFQQLSGFQIFVHYVPKILQNNGWGTEMVFLGTIVVGSVKLIMVVVCQMLTDKVGRRVLLILSASAMTLFIGLLGVVIQFADYIDHSKLYIIALLVCIVGAFSIGYGPVPFLLSSELFAVNVRSKAMGFCAVLNRLAATFVTLTFFSLQSAISTYGAYYFYAILGLGFAVYIYCKVPETKSRSLEEITKTMMESKQKSIS